jgi:hypothetical protein
MKKIEENLKHTGNVVSINIDYYLNKIDTNQYEVKIKAEDVRHHFKMMAVDYPILGTLADLVATRTENMTDFFADEEGVRKVEEELPSESSLLSTVAEFRIAAEELRRRAQEEKALLPESPMDEVNFLESENSLDWNFTEKGIRGDLHAVKLFNKLSEPSVEKPLSLNLSHNQIGGDTWARKLAEFLKKDHNLTSLSLSHNQIGGDTWAKELGNALKQNSTLKTLDLSCNKICGNTWAEILKDVQEVNKEIKIALEGNPMERSIFSLEEMQRALVSESDNYDDYAFYN